MRAQQQRDAQDREVQKLDGEPQPQQAAVVMMPGKVAGMTAYLGSTFPDQLIQEQKAVQAGARVGSDAAQHRVESHLVLVGNPVPRFQRLQRAQTG